MLQEEIKRKKLKKKEILHQKGGTALEIETLFRSMYSCLKLSVEINIIKSLDKIHNIRQMNMHLVSKSELKIGFISFCVTKTFLFFR